MLLDTYMRELSGKYEVFFRYESDINVLYVEVRRDKAKCVCSIPSSSLSDESFIISEIQRMIENFEKEN